MSRPTGNSVVPKNAPERKSSVPASTPAVDPNSDSPFSVGAFAARQSAGARPDGASLQRKFGNQAIERALRTETKVGAAGASAPIQRASTNPERHAQVVDSIVARAAGFHISRKPKFSTPAITVTPTPAGRVQRYVMSNAEWKDKSSKVGKQRSVKLLDIDEKLEKYNAAQQKPLEERLMLLRALRDAIWEWSLTKKQDKQGKVVSVRLEAVRTLNRAVQDELETLTGRRLESENEPTAENLTSASDDLRKRATREMQATLSLSEKKRKELHNQPNVGQWADLYSEATSLGVRATVLANHPNVSKYAQGVEAAVKMMGIIAMRFATGTNSGEYTVQKIRAQRAIILNSWFGLDRQLPLFGELSRKLQDVLENLNDFGRLAGIDLGKNDGDGGGIRDLKNEDPDGFEAIKEPLSLIDQASTKITYYGGTDNSGFKESYQGKPEGEDTRTGSQKSVADFFSKMDPGSDNKAGQDYMWGTGDLVGGIVGMFSGGKEIYDAICILRDPKATNDQKRQAKEALAQSGAATVGSFIRYVAGALTIHRGTGYKEGSDTSTTSGGSNFKFTADGTDMTTDIRMVSDFAGILTGVIGFINQLIEIYKWMTGEAKEEWQGGTRQKVEVIGNGLSKLAGAIQTGAGAGFNTAKMVMQIEGGGAVAGTGEQMTKVGLAGGAGAGAMPIIGLVVSAMATIKNGYKMTRLGIRKYDIKKRLKELYADRKSVDLGTAEAIEMVDLTLYKRMVRVGIELGHNLSQLAGGAATVSGMGSAVGMSISMASTLAKIGQVGVRVGKQKARNRKAKQRKKKNEANHQTFESYSDWKRRKQKQAGDGKWKRFWAGVDIQFTPNWDKTSDAKGMERREAALKIVEMNDETVYKGLGIHEHNLAQKDLPERIKLVVEKLNKRD